MIAATLLFGAGLAVAGPTYTLTNLGTLGAASSGAGINELGQATGWTYDASGDIRAFLWDVGTMRNLGSLPPGLGWPESWGTAINDAGQVTGSSVVSQTGTHAFVYRDGAMIDIGTLGGFHSSGWGINNAGQVTGQALTARGEPHAFIYSGGVMRDLGTFGGVYSAGFAINASGQVTGFAQTAGDPRDPPEWGPIHAFRSDDGVLTDLGTLGGSHSEGHGINDAGDVAGWSGTTGNLNAHAFLYHDGRMDDLGTLGGGSSFASDVNNQGDVVGWSDAPGFLRGFIYSDGVMTDLNDVLPAELRSEWTIFRAYGINDSGQIIASAGDSNGSLRAVILTPTIPEPSTAALLAAGLGAVAWARRHKFARRRSCS